MRKMTLMLVGTASAAAAIIGGVPAAAAAGSTAERGEVREVVAADKNCKETKSAYYPNGKVQTYDRYSCAGSAMCKDYDNDQDYDEGGDCKGDNNRTSSVINLGWNNSKPHVRFYQGPYYNRYAFCLKNGQYINKLDKYNNVLSSHKWVRSC